MESCMDKALIMIILITVVILILAPSMLLINCMFNDDSKKDNDLSDENLMKLEIKKSLLKMLEIWIQENSLSHEQIAHQLAVSLKVVSDIVHQRSDKFTIDRLVGLVLRTGKSVKFIINKDVQT